VNPRIYYNLGLIYQYLNNPVKAESSLLKAKQLTPNEFDVLYALADFYIKKQDYSSALEYAKEISRMYPTNSAGQQLIEYINQLSIK
jgi:tetratricopeptide (TPR) repeat protein